MEFTNFDEFVSACRALDHKKCISYRPPEEADLEAVEEQVRDALGSLPLFISSKCSKGVIEVGNP